MTIEKLVYGGEGLSRVDGQVILSPFVLPGETAEVERIEERKGVVRSRLTRIESASEHRVQPGCPYFGRCGGCHYQHASYEYQLQQKVEVLREVIRRVGKFDAPKHIEVVSGPEWGYRNRSQFHLQKGRIGYLEAGSHTLCPITHCPISSPKLNEALGAVIAMMKQPHFPNFIRSLELFTNETDVQVNVLESDRPVARHFFDRCADGIPGFVRSALEYPAGDDTFRVSHRSFFQVNRFLVDALVTAALDGVSGDRAADLYAGVGLFSLPLARKFNSVSAVEASTSALRDITFNAERAGVRLEMSQSAVDEWLATATGSFDFILADPPRAGLGKRAITELVRLKPQRLNIVACDPATLARDLTGLLASGYHITRMTLVDLFPQTYHMETVVWLEKAP